MNGAGLVGLVELSVEVIKRIEIEAIDLGWSWRCLVKVRPFHHISGITIVLKLSWLVCLE